MAGSLVVSDINGAGFVDNLIINPEFTLNQRGSASRTTTSSAYNYDRWYYDGTHLYQGVENESLRNGTYSLSWSGSSTAAYSLNTAGSSGQGAESYTAITSGSQITISGLTTETLWVRFTGDLANLTEVMLSKGTGASSFVGRSYGEELALCQRYYEVLETSSEIVICPMAQYNSTVAYGVYQFTQKRAVPTVTFLAGSTVKYFRGSSAIDIGTPARETIGTQTLRLSVINSATVGTAGWLAFTDGGGALQIDAEL